MHIGRSPLVPRKSASNHSRDCIPDTPSEAVARVCVARLRWNVESLMLDGLHAPKLPGLVFHADLSHG